MWSGCSFYQLWLNTLPFGPSQWRHPCTVEYWWTGCIFWPAAGWTNQEGNSPAFQYTVDVGHDNRHNMQASSHYGVVAWWWSMGSCSTLDRFLWVHNRSQSWWGFVSTTQYCRPAIWQGHFQRWHFYQLGSWGWVPENLLERVQSPVCPGTTNLGLSKHIVPGNCRQSKN